MGRCRYTGFYGCPERERRRESWGLIRELASRSNLPWCIIGDFNDMMFAHEKVGRRRHPRFLLEGFSETVNECGLRDLGFVGNQFTWERSRGSAAWVQERLDRGLSNQGWMDLFPSAEVKVLDISTSNHFSLFLQLNKLVYSPNRRRLRF